MDNNIIKKLGTLLANVPKKDLEKNIEKAKKILKESKNKDLKSLINSPEVTNILGKETNTLNDFLDKNPSLNNIPNPEEISNTLNEDLNI